MSETADLMVAKRIAAELVRLGFLKPERAERFVQDLSIGNIKSEDWKLLADLPHDSGGGDAH